MGYLADSLLRELTAATIFTVPLFNGIAISVPAIVTLGLIVVLLLFSLLATRNMKIRDPGKLQVTAEVLVGGLERFFAVFRRRKAKRLKLHTKITFCAILAVVLAVLFVPADWPSVAKTLGLGLAAIGGFFGALWAKITAEAAFTIGGIQVAGYVAATWLVMAILLILSLLSTSNLTVENPRKHQRSTERFVAGVQRFFGVFRRGKAKDWKPCLDALLAGIVLSAALGITFPINDTAVSTAVDSGFGAIGSFFGGFFGWLAAPAAFTVPLFGGIPVAGPVVATWIVMAILVVIALITTSNLKVRDVSGGQGFAESVALGLESFFGDFHRGKAGRCKPCLDAILGGIVLSTIFDIGFPVSGKTFASLMGMGYSTMDTISEDILDELTAQTAFTIPIFGGIQIAESVVVTWIVMAVLLLLAFIFIRDLKVENPGKRQTAVEFVVVGLQNVVEGILGEKGRKYVPYLTTVLVFIGVSNIFGIFGFKPPTKDMNVTAALALMSIVLVQIAAIDTKGVKGWIGGFGEPSKLILPLNIMELAIRPISLCMRLFGNVLGSFVIMKLLESVIKLAVPMAMSFYFDFFDGFIQAYVFVFLSSLFIKEAIE